MGANINAKSITGDIPDGFMLPAVLSEISKNEPINRSDIIHFFINNGFNPDLFEGRCGGQVLNHFINCCVPGQATLNDLKTLLDIGCNPSVKTFLYDDEFEEENAINRAFEGICDAFQIDHDFNYMFGFSAVLECLIKASMNEKYRNINLVTDACNSVIQNIYSFGECEVGKDDIEENSFSFIAPWHHPFEEILQKGTSGDAPRIVTAKMLQPPVFRHVTSAVNTLKSPKNFEEFRKSEQSRGKYYQCLNLRQKLLRRRQHP